MSKNNNSNNSYYFACVTWNITQSKKALDPSKNIVNSVNEDNYEQKSRVLGVKCEKLL